MRLFFTLLNTIDSRKVSKYGQSRAPGILLIFTCFTHVYGFIFNFGKILASVLKSNLSKLKAQNPSITIYDTYNSDWLTFTSHFKCYHNGFNLSFEFQLILRITRSFRLFKITCQTLILVLVIKEKIKLRTQIAFRLN